MQSKFANASTKNPEIYPSAPFLLNGDGASFFGTISPNQSQKLRWHVVSGGCGQTSLFDDSKVGKVNRQFCVTFDVRPDPCEVKLGALGKQLAIDFRTADDERRLRHETTGLRVDRYASSGAAQYRFAIASLLAVMLGFTTTAERISPVKSTLLEQQEEE